jgi:transposase-like protein
MPQTNEEFVQSCGNKCPSCQSENISAEDFEPEGAHAWRPVSCDDCGASWNETYSLTGYSELEPANETDNQGA